MKYWAMIRKQVGSRYEFERRYSGIEIRRLRLENHPEQRTLSFAILTAGCVKLEAVLYQNEDGLTVGYDLFVREKPSDPEWICYDSLSDPVELNDRKMENVMCKILDHYVRESGLSYTENQFESLPGKAPKRK